MVHRWVVVHCPLPCNGKIAGHGNPRWRFPKCLNFQKQFATTLQKISYHHQNKTLVEGWRGFWGPYIPRKVLLQSSEHSWITDTYVLDSKKWAVGVSGVQREEESFYIGEGNIGRQKHLPFSTISQGNMWLFTTPNIHVFFFFNNSFGIKWLNFKISFQNICIIIWKLGPHCFQEKVLSIIHTSTIFATWIWKFTPQKINWIQPIILKNCED